MDHTQEHGGLGRKHPSPCRVKSAESAAMQRTHPTLPPSHPSLVIARHDVLLHPHAPHAPFLPRLKHRIRFQQRSNMRAPAAKLISFDTSTHATTQPQPNLDPNLTPFASSSPPSFPSPLSFPVAPFAPVASFASPLPHFASPLPPLRLPFAFARSNAPWKGPSWPASSPSPGCSSWGAAWSPPPTPWWMSTWRPCRPTPPMV